MKIVVINSSGPMGATVVGAVVEKFGYLHLPTRNLGLNRCLLSGGRAEFRRYRENVHRLFELHSRASARGGVNMLDRDTGPAVEMIDRRLVAQELTAIRDDTRQGVAAFYDRFRNLYADALRYKHSRHAGGKHVEYTTYLDRYPVETLCQRYRDAFQQVVFIHMHRDFCGWVESLVSQKFSGSKRFGLLLLHPLLERYRAYERQCQRCPGLNIDFETLFRPGTRRLIRQVAAGLDESVPEIAWETESYDLYGKLRSFDRTFTRADYDGRYLSQMTRLLVKHCFRKNKVTRFHDALFYLFYLYDLFRFLVRGK